MTKNPKCVINLVEDFSPYPGGRYEDNGPFSGEKFRTDILEPAMASSVVITVDLDGAAAIAPSFLDESFGVIMERIGKDKFDKKFIILLTDDPDAIDDLNEIRHRRFKK
ncbi:STAS-like domain-containing protein [Verrucomicrobiaceae bacterium N1E253]|uniref:STAS-like domain-containing protein n=1 Tax=Oceaniferula marina TaxID=2748318 RepID=A0A851GKK7_9BACT|nr:STAS-like domain-containing protein [Oceaniferula marina]NWK57572.1 STAS-like domain-containing protein [Oceaniferula marina]